jgi:hypothetical protein
LEYWEFQEVKIWGSDREKLQKNINDNNVQVQYDLHDPLSFIIYQQINIQSILWIRHKKRKKDVKLNSRDISYLICWCLWCPYNFISRYSAHFIINFLYFGKMDNLWIKNKRITKITTKRRLWISITRKI